MEHVCFLIYACVPTCMIEIGMGERILNGGGGVTSELQRRYLVCRGSGGIWKIIFLCIFLLEIGGEEVVGVLVPPALPRL